MVMLIDTREQSPLKFKHPYLSAVERVTLPVGDYGCRFKDGSQSPIYFERKSLNDLYGTLGKGHKRFKRMLEKSVALDIELKIVIEGTLSKVMKGNRFSSMDSDVVAKQLFTIQHKYDVPVVFCKDRVEMTKYILEVYCAEGRFNL